MKSWDRFEFVSAAARGSEPSRVARFESLIGARLPNDYREFLLEVNGGSPTDRSGETNDGDPLVDVDWQGREPRRTSGTAIVHYLLVTDDWSGVFEDERSEALTLPGVYRTFVKEERALPYGTVPIGHDPGGSLFLLDVAGQQPGAVLFWARRWYDPERQQADEYHNVGFVAPTFSEFLDKIRFEE